MVLLLLLLTQAGRPGLIMQDQYDSLIRLADCFT